MLNDWQMLEHYYEIKDLYFFIFLGLLSACKLTGPTEQGPKQALGTITGMALGGKIANDLTEDSSKNNLWTLAGVTLGAFWVTKSERQWIKPIY